MGEISIPTPPTPEDTYGSGAEKKKRLTEIKNSDIWKNLVAKYPNLGTDNEFLLLLEGLLGGSTSSNNNDDD